MSEEYYELHTCYNIELKNLISDIRTRLEKVGSDTDKLKGFFHYAWIRSAEATEGIDELREELLEWAEDFSLLAEEIEAEEQKGSRAVDFDAEGHELLVARPVGLDCNEDCTDNSEEQPLEEDYYYDKHECFNIEIESILDDIRNGLVVADRDSGALLKVSKAANRKIRKFAGEIDELSEELQEWSICFRDFWLDIQIPANSKGRDFLAEASEELRDSPRGLECDETCLIIE